MLYPLFFTSKMDRFRFKNGHCKSGNAFLRKLVHNVAVTIIA